MQQMMGLNNFVYKTGQIDSPKRWKYSKKSIKKNIFKWQLSKCNFLLIYSIFFITCMEPQTWNVKSDIGC